MSLDIEVKGEPASLRTAAHGLTAIGTRVQAAADDTRTARDHSGEAWHGRAGDGFREAMAAAAPRIDDVGHDLDTLGTALRRHADDLDDVKSAMHRAAGVARGAGLTVTATTIEPPGAGGSPTGPNGPAGPTGSAGSAATAQREAYARAEHIVSVARSDEHDSQQRVLRTLRRSVSGDRPFSMSDIVPNLAGALLAQPPSQYSSGPYQTQAQGRWNVDPSDFECPQDQPVPGPGHTVGGTNGILSTGIGLVNALGSENPPASLGAGALTGLATKGVDSLPGVCMPNLPPEPGDIDPPPPPPPVPVEKPAPDDGGGGLLGFGKDVINTLAWPGDQVEKGVNELGEALPDPTSPGEGGGPPPVPLPIPAVP